MCDPIILPLLIAVALLVVWIVERDGSWPPTCGG